MKTPDWLRQRPVMAALMAVALLLMLMGLTRQGPLPGEDGAILSERAGRHSFEVRVRSVGELEAAKAVVLGSEVRGDRGKIISIIEDGTKVEQGDVLVRLDPTPFEEKANQLESKLQEAKTKAAALEQVVQWERNQSEREEKSLQFELQAARLDLIKLEKGDGPLELARLEGDAHDALEDWQKKTRYIEDLDGLAKRGFANPTEVAQSKQKAEESKRKAELAKRKLESYRDHVLPASLQKARTGVQKLETNLEQLKKGAGFKVGQAMAALKQAQLEIHNLGQEVKVARQDLANTVIRAPISGLVVLREEYINGQKQKPKVGDMVLQNQPLVYLPDVSRMIVKTQVREVDLHKIALGKPALVTVDAYPDLRLAGKADFIGVLAKTRGDVQSADKYFQLTISLGEGDPRLRPGMTCRVVIDCAQVADSLSVPVSAVFREGDKDYCFVESGQGYELREVALGVANENWAQVRAGLSEGERVALSRPAEERVRGRVPLSQQKAAVAAGS